MDRTYSEKIAGLFVIGAGLPLLLQGAMILFSLPVLLFYLLLGVAASISGQAGIYGLVFLGLVALRVGAYIFDGRLLRGYVRHYRGNLDEKAIDLLWIKTIVWNGIFFFPSAYLNLRRILAGDCYLGCNPYDQSEFSLVFIFRLLTIWWGIATFVPFLALASVEDEGDPLS